MRYDLTRLGAQEFEEMSQALAIAVLGSGVSVFGSGPDGGREATFEGLMSYPQPEPITGPWNGYGVLQAKFHRATSTTKADTDWFLDQIRKELREWCDADSQRVQFGRRPEYLVLTTNVVLSPVPANGGIDRVDQLIRHFSTQKGLALKGWVVWHHDHLCRLLDVHDSVRRTYAGFTAVGDVLDEAQKALARLAPHELPPNDFSALLTTQAAKELMAQQWVRLGQAGDPTNRKLLLSEVAIDLPAEIDAAPGRRDRETVPGVIAHIVEQGDRIRRGRPADDELPHLTIVGGPGQGKTTIGQLLCQVYRVALLSERPTHTLGPDVPDLIEHYRRHLAKLGIPTPRCRRWPLRITLSRFADEFAEHRSTSIMSYLADQARRTGPINPRMLRAWLREWPWLVVLDGLDEVANPEIREATLDAVKDFLVDAAQEEADLLVVTTTRPQGYRKEFGSTYYRQLTLQPMMPENSLEYAEHLAEIQFANDPEMQDLILHRLRIAAAEQATARLMRSPLQIAIMTLLLERRSRAPQDRHGLFESYYNTLYDREVAKETPDSRLLDEQRRNVDRLHERVGLLLQIRAERAGEAEAQLPEDELRSVAYQRLIEEEYPPLQADRLAGELLKLATDRLVLLVGMPNSTIGFEIRSLQELMAARALFAVGDQELLRILKRLALSAHWRNTWLFAASRLFTQRETLRNELVLMLDELDTDTPIAAFLMPGAQLAVQMLDEDIAVGQPRYTRLLVQRALHLLDTYPGEPINLLAAALHDASSWNTTIIHEAIPAIENRINGRGKATVTALDAIAAWAELPGNASISARSLADRIKRSTPTALEHPVRELKRFGAHNTWRSRSDTMEKFDFASGRGTLLEIIGEAELEPALRARLQAIIDHRSNSLPNLDDLTDTELQSALVRVVGTLEPRFWPYAADIHQRLNHWYARQPVNDEALARLTVPVGSEI